ncbi:ATP-binding cassette subfamily G member 4 isoform X1 [Topomyia yanbarensis]|uniref:ATP-binding cassette subfamily G member 4 isoform X1 n=2 Tax=Topomyia yanbarensis TaxID=2498891 RepID=UPI00273CE986|nr:ATP-binding cassette subfamily G member 4 isoform X1 [Topomyia yanbarensis]XP_058830829.1 ATP-binding cassette subfamily G member 4 isoform X1 [Topomyia yanbarensis]XP_058830830.1 ATP-binding cassette subfamily G member 4 isoform X1 [Topomyia yanbarensis]XP_058830831.1 ATP-binding cassette subfamily G member 4 isoform X1 [Topomyia yanbarensis]XP_058830832.1 ATP-binding cassette subfamily G member 4 isoform X1 [Topomyia yanbarensis]
MAKDVEFQDIVYAVNVRRSFISESRKRTIVKGVSGVFRHGQLSAIMGPSGAGKSSLLNAISGYRKSGVEGTIHLNRKASCYITQEDHHQQLLTIEELMYIACQLKIKGKADFAETITNVLSDLNLNHRRNVTADRLSGGERKRLSIALEMVANPSIFFLDEPTSGLDEVTAATCVRLFRDLAKQGRTVVCTIHQPSASIFALFDHIYVVARGLCVFQGSPKAVVPFLSHMRIECPRHYNPADFIIEICDSESAEVLPALCEAMQNGKSICVKSQFGAPAGSSALIVDEEPNSLEPVSDFVIKPTVTSMILEQQRPRVSTLVQKMKQITRFFHSPHAVSGFVQFWVLFQLMWTKIMRNRTVLWIQFIHHVICAIFIGLIFFNAANDGARMFDHLKFCLGVCFFFCYTQIMVPILSYPREVKLVKKECFNRWYGLFPYYLALTLSRLPIQIFLNIIFSMVVYWLAGLPAELFRYTLFTIVGLAVSLCAEGFGLMIGATFNVMNGSAIGPLTIAPFLGLAIYGFDFAPQIPALMQWLMRASFIRGGVVSIVLVVFGYNRQRLDCSEMYCHFDDPKVLLHYVRIDNTTLLFELSILIAMTLFYRLLCYLSLRRRFYK